MKEEKPRISTCFHCGNTGVLKPLGKTRWDNEFTYRNENGDIIGYSLLEHEDYFVYECPVCNKPVIVREYVLDAVEGEKSERIVYPTFSVSATGVPEKIYKAFESAVRTKGIDTSICLLSLRRVLELICLDKGAKGKSLEKMIQDLVEKKIFPPMIEDACFIIRQLGNEAAHSNRIDGYTYDMEQVITYISCIIDYLYSMPYRVGDMKRRMEERKKL